MITLAGEQVAITELDPAAIAREKQLIGAALALAKSMTPLPDRDPAQPDPLDELCDPELDERLKTWIGTAIVARRRGIPIFSDDRCVRLNAQREGIPAFGTASLLTALHERDLIGDDQLSEARMSLLRGGAWGLGPTSDEIVALAGEQNWQPNGRWLGALNDPSAWHLAPGDRTRLCVELLHGAYRCDPALLDGGRARARDRRG